MERSLAAFTRPRPLYDTLAQRGVARALSFTRRRFADELLALVERAAGDNLAPLDAARREGLRQAAQVGLPGYRVRSGLPVVGRAVAWLRRQLTAHLKEPYLDPVIAGQERFNRELLETVLPALDESLREQRRLRAEVDLLRAQLDERARDNGS
jgi:O-antigen biosynthesis protein